MDLRERLRRETEGWRYLNANLGAWLMQEFVVRKGIEYPARALPPGYPKMQAKYCFANAAYLQRRWPGRKLRYCEGFVSRPRLPISIHHAWIIDAEDQIIDPTLETPSEYEYLGVPYTMARYHAEMHQRRTLSLFLDDAGAVNFKFLLRECPELRELIDQSILSLLE
jgi:hypothetical protein